ncbi:ImmA/IrrE family metallo-endopeptidase [Paraclostridium ghonii]|uniref:ImmA/IrrE family metallo-endopeptidase n=1 Tax=Paraclostridium ghonii TaxID=29358 RepID=UPI00202CCFE0|nr:ImmA/IrrE family metallo-endopeptidase [Paeniclostridium ghonii]MCM0167536.1 hypothetical protein [Paeniclostridium ghonii]
MGKFKMTRVEKLFDLIEKLGIQVYFNDLKQLGFLGLYIELEKSAPTILIDNSIKNKEKELFKVLLEELGHFYTSSGNSLSDTSTYRKKLNISKCELKSEKWLCEYLISEKDLIDAINSSPTSTEDICEYLDIDIEILISRLRSLSLKKQSLNLGNNKFLMLTKLPNICVYDAAFFSN